MIIFTDGRTPWTSPLPKYRTTQTQNKHVHTPNIHALCGIRTHEPSFRASEDSSCLRPLGYCYRHCLVTICPKTRPSAFRTNHLNTYRREGGKDKPGKGEFYSYGRSGNLRAAVSGASNLAPYKLPKLTKQKGRTAISRSHSTLRNMRETPRFTTEKTRMATTTKG
jgi:hypothetical protein